MRRSYTGPRGLFLRRSSEGAGAFKTHRPPRLGGKIRGAPAARGHPRPAAPCSLRRGGRTSCKVRTSCRAAASSLAVARQGEPVRPAGKQGNSTADARGWGQRRSRSLVANIAGPHDEPRILGVQGSIRVHQRASAVEFPCFPAGRTPPRGKPRLTQGNNPCTNSPATRHRVPQAVARKYSMHREARRATARCGGISRLFQAEPCGTRHSKKFGTTDAHRCTRMGRSPAGLFTAGTLEPNLGSRADAVGTVPSVCICTANRKNLRGSR